MMNSVSSIVSLILPDPNHMRLSRRLPGVSQSPPPRSDEITLLEVCRFDMQCTAKSEYDERLARLEEMRALLQRRR